MEFISKSIDDTQKCAKILASLCGGGELICLIGDLGAGKTAFTQGFAQALEIKRPVTSPTFVLMQEHQGKTLAGKKVTLYHMDAYRIGSNQEAWDMGLSELWERDDAIMIIEWADRIAGILPDDRIDIYMTHGKDSTRKWKVEGFGEHHQDIVKRLPRELAIIDILIKSSKELIHGK
ncbi:MAG: tRNA (adenosine(37)-N6)-threonylcarbamoyltransferase complex ATPase subunit type 1 TsaE [Patescibacteria group bacterium]